MSRFWQALTIALCAFLFAAAVYRAATLSITIDEAYTYTQFVKDWGATEYDANNHVLYTLLAKLTTTDLGPGDLALRTPALAGAALFYGALYRLVFLLTGATFWLPLGVAVTGANTYVTDLLPLARGYGLALAVFTLALCLLVEATPRPREVGIALGLAVTANLTFAFPVTGLFGGLLWRDRRKALVPIAWAAGVAAGLMVIPMWTAQPSHFYYGVDSLAASMRSLAGNSLVRDGADHSLPVQIGMVVLPLILAATAAAGFVRRLRSALLFLLGATIAGGWALLLTGHLTTGLLYPYGRTGICWILIAGVSMTALAGAFRPARFGLAPVALAAVYFYARSWSTAATLEWDWDAGTREIAQRIASLPHPPDRPLRVGASVPLPHTLNYYRVINEWTWMEDVKLDNVRSERFDYYVLLPADRAWAEQEKMTILYEHPVAHTILARR